MMGDNKEFIEKQEGEIVEPGANITSPQLSSDEPLSLTSPEIQKSYPVNLTSFLWELFIGAGNQSSPSSTAPPSATLVSTPNSPISSVDQTSPEYEPDSDPITGCTPSSETNAKFKRNSQLVSTPLNDSSSKPIVIDTTLYSTDEEIISRPRIVLTGRKVDQNIIMTHDLAEMIRPALPPLQRESTQWKLLYSLEQHGISLHTLFDCCRDKGPVLLAIRDRNGAIFGAYLTDPIQIHVGYYGNGRCFLWRYQNNRVDAYNWTGANDYLILSETDFFAMGGGDGQFGLWIDSELYHGHSGPCKTFENEQLSSEPEFECMDLEVWGFKL